MLFSAISMWYLDTPRAVLAQVGNASPWAKEAENCYILGLNPLVAWRGFGGATGDAIVRLRVDQVPNFGVLRVLGEDG